MTRHRVRITARVPQGSVLGPLFGSTMYNGALKLALPESTEIVALTVVTIEFSAAAEESANTAVKAVEALLAVAGVELWSCL